MPQRIHIVDAFTDRPFGGNPAAVCVLGRQHDDTWMQNLAAEMNLSETAFVAAEQDYWRLRWFTPKIEVDLCGHATLASSHILWESGVVGPNVPIDFETRSGRLTCVRSAEWIEMDFPAEPPGDAGDPGDLLAALKTTGVIVGHKRNRMDYLVEVADERTLRALTPDMRLLANLPVRGVIVTAASEDARFDFVSRFFAPPAGVNEDPVTGSAHCCLGPYWGTKLAKQELVGFQASSRGGIVRVTLRENRVILAGKAITVLRGELSEQCHLLGPL